MATFLLIIIYAAYVGLGLPDSLFGAAWPAIQQDFLLPLSAANYVTVIVSGCTIISSLLGARFVNKFGTWAVITFSTGITALALLGYALSPNLLIICLLAFPMGLGAGAIDSALNNYIALYYNAMHMNFLHCFYGVGVIVSPYVLSLILKTSTWQNGYITIFYLQIAITLLLALSYPFWKKVRHKPQVGTEETVVPRTLSFGEMAKNPLARLSWSMFIAANAIEGAAGTWGSAYLVYTHGMNMSDGAKLVTLFYVGLAGGRFLSGLLSKKLTSWQLLLGGAGVIGAGALLMFYHDVAAASISLFLIGFGVGPIHPNLMHLTPRHFGADVSASYIGSQMASAYLGILAAPPLFGILAQHISTAILPVFELVWLVIFVIVTTRFLQVFKKQSAPHSPQ